MENPKSLLYFCIIYIIWCKISNIIASEFRIAGGQPIHISQAKFVVQVVKNDSMCAGSLVTPNLVVTAAHCVYDYKVTDITVIAGATFYERGGQHSKVVATFIPDYYSYTELYWDVAIIKLHTPLRGSNIGTIKLCNSRFHPGNHMTLYGWGKTNELDSTFTESVFQKRRQLKEVEVPVLPTKRCEPLLYTKMPKILFCAGVPNLKDACSGDSGGPAVFNNQLCGVISFGGFCPSIGFYVNINRAKDFIENVIKIESHKF